MLHLTNRMWMSAKGIRRGSLFHHKPINNSTMIRKWPCTVFYEWCTFLNVCSRVNGVCCIRCASISIILAWSWCTLIILFFFSYVLQLSLYSTEQMHISENSDINLFTMLSKSSTIPKDCNYVSYKFAAYIQPMHQSFISCMYLFYNKSFWLWCMYMTLLVRYSTFVFPFSVV